MALSLLSFCLLVVFTVSTQAFKFGIPARFIPQQISPTATTKSRDTVQLPPVQRNLEPITVDQSRQLIDVSDNSFTQTILNNEGLTVVLFTRYEPIPTLPEPRMIPELVFNSLTILFIFFLQFMVQPMQTNATNTW